MAYLSTFEVEIDGIYIHGNTGKHTVRPMDAYMEYNFNIPWVFVEIFPKNAVRAKRRGLRLMVCFRGMNLGVRRPLVHPGRDQHGT